MKVLIIGNGGRENAIVRKIFDSKSFQNSRGKMFYTAVNPGMDKFSESIDIKPADISSLLKFALENEISFTVVGPEVPLSMGIADEFEKNGLKIFGPSKAAAEIESSKVFAKNLMTDHNVPTAQFRSFKKENISEALSYSAECNYPAVFKADGLAAGKGVVILKDKKEAGELIKSFCEGKSLNDTGSEFIIEEYLDGEEVSVFAVCDGSDYLLLPFSQDHKRIFEGEKGNNTGGMGAVAPVKKFMTASLTEKIKNRIIEPVLNAMNRSGRNYKGCLYCGLMIVNDEPFVIEFNCRFGDPETQAVLPLIESDFLELLIASSDGNLGNYKLKIFDKYACSVVMASKGYPGKYESGKKISGLENEFRNCLILHSGTAYNDNHEIISSGGRVLSVTGVSDESLKDACRIAYENIEKIKFDGAYFRKDIGFRQLKYVLS